MIKHINTLFQSTNYIRMYTITYIARTIIKSFLLLLIKITGTAFHIMIKSTNNFAIIIKICD